MALIATSMRTKVERWDTRIIDPMTASVDNIKDFMDTKLYLYTMEGISDYNL
jgi:hypothetical protein